MILSDLHIHTTYCDGNSTAEQTVKRAISLGMKAVGFSGHSYTSFDTSYCMTKQSLKEYIKTINDLKKQYADNIEIYLGLERDFYADYDDNKYDYIIGSVHYVCADGEYIEVDNTPEQLAENVKKYYSGDYLKLVKAYYDNVALVAQKTHADIIGHFDLVTKFSSYKLFDDTSKEYQRMAFEALEGAVKCCKLFEMNTGAVSRGYKKEAYPSAFLLKSIKKLGGRIILSSDSHSCDNLCYGFNNCCELLRQCGFKSVTTMQNGIFTEIGI